MRTLTLEERERMAFISGDTELAVYLGKLIDLDNELHDLEQANEKLKEDIADLENSQ